MRAGQSRPITRHFAKKKHLDVCQPPRHRSTLDAPAITTLHALAAAAPGLVTPPLQKYGCHTGSRRRIFNEARIHKYTHANHELSVLNMKILQFEFKFRYIEFCSGIINVDAEAIHLTIHRWHLALSSSQRLRCLPVQGPAVLCLDLPLVAALGVTERERRTSFSCNVWATKA
jgi:hypothetical protein